MDNWVGGLIGVAAIVMAVVVIAFLWQAARDAWYWCGAKLFGWSDHERVMRQTAYLDREAARAERLAKKDAVAAVNADRRRFGVVILTSTIGALAIYLSLPWWGSMLVMTGVYTGGTMAAGLAFKWY